LLTGASSKEFCAGVLDKTDMLLLPSTLFDYGMSHFRVGFGREGMPEALELFEEYVEAGSFSKP
jgi:aspartate/methionine/tyrosine aminotransferase